MSPIVNALLGRRGNSLLSTLGYDSYRQNIAKSVVLVVSFGYIARRLEARLLPCNHVQIAIG